jgi:hypothetical protein
VDGRERRIAENETRFREVNERLERVQTSVGTGNGGIAVLCECGDRDCSEQITLTLADYEAVRADPVAFVIKTGHEAPEAEHLVERHTNYSIVRKQAKPASWRTSRTNATAERLTDRRPNEAAHPHEDPLAWISARLPYTTDPPREPAVWLVMRAT